MSARLRILACAALPLVGCVETITLGSECRDPAAPCASGRAGLTPEAGSGGPDASVLPTVGDDAEAPAVTVDASLSDVGADAQRFPGLQNGQFEITRGGPGALAFELLDPLPLGFNLAEPWAACRPGFSAVTAAKSERSLDAPDVFATEGAVFIESELGLSGGGGLRQTLPVPLRSGERYGFRIDARAARGARVALRLFGAQLECVQAVELAASEELPERWVSLCMRFVAPTELPQLILVPDSLDKLITGVRARVFFDNLRADPLCD